MVRICSETKKIKIMQFTRAKYFPLALFFLKIFSSVQDCSNLSLTTPARYYYHYCTALKQFKHVFAAHEVPPSNQRQK